MDLPFGTSAYSRDRGNIAELPVINMFAENAPVEGRIVLQSRPGLTSTQTIGSGPIYGLYRRDGVMDGDLCSLSGTTLYKASTALGTVSGGGYVSFAGDEEELTVNAGTIVYQTDGTTLTAMDFPDGANVIRLLDLAGYNIAIREGTGRFYWRLWGVDTWDALDYATEENEPDQLLDGQAIDDYLVLFGTETTGFWPKTGDADLPFAPTQGRVFEKGIRATGCCAAFDNTVAWVASKRQGSIVYRAGNVPERISDAGIEERIGKSATCRVDSYFFEGHEFLRIRLDSTTHVFDAQTGQWHELASWGRTNFAGLCVVDGPVFGDDTNGRVWEYGSDYFDDGGVLERRFRAGAILDGPAIVDRLRLTVNVGQTDSLTGDYADPVVEMRASDDGAQTWTEWESTELGGQGDYRRRAEYRRLGMFDDPGMVFEFRCTDPVPFTVRNVQVNPQSGGRGR